MATTVPATGLQLRSLVKQSGELELSLASVPIAAPAADEVVIRIEAAPINPSDLGLLLGAADLSTAKQSGTPDNPLVTARIPERFMRAMAPGLESRKNSTVDISPLVAATPALSAAMGAPEDTGDPIIY